MKTLQYAVRFLLRARAYTVINLLGLAFSLACCIILVRYIHRELTVDTNSIRPETMVVPLRDMYGNVYIGRNYPEAESDSLRIKEESIVERCLMVGMEQDNIVYDGTNFAANILAADSTFFHFFAYPLYRGEAALDAPDAAIVTRRFAERVFGKDNPVGKVLDYGKQSVVVRGVIDQPACKTSWNFDILVSRRLRPDWGRLNMELMRVLPGIDLKQLNEKAYVPRIIDGYQFRYKFISWKDIYFETSIMGNYKSILHFGNRQYVRILTGVVGLLLVVGILNFINLYMVYMMKRSREYGIKKVFGIGRLSLFCEIWLENFLLMAAAMFLAWLFMEVSAGLVTRLMGEAVGYTAFDWQLSLGILLLLPLLTAVYPFFRYGYGTPVSSMRAASVSKKAVGGRMVFLFFQYGITFLLIVLSLYFKLHFDFLVNTPPGFRTERIMRAVLQHENQQDWSRERFARNELLGQKLDECPYIESWIHSDCSVFNSSKDDIINDKNQTVSMLVSYPSVDFFKIFGLKVLEGKLPDKAQSYVDLKIVLNRAAMKALGYTRREDAFIRSSKPLTVSFFNGKRVEFGTSMVPVEAVIDDYFPGHVTEGIKPMCFVVGMSSASAPFYIAVKEGKEQALIAYLRQVEREIYNTDEFEYAWVSDEVAGLYVHDRKVAAVYSVFALIAIVVSCLGLFGISLFDIHQRYREIAIRKVNGARLNDLHRLLFSRYIKVLAASFVVAAPLGWYILHRYTEGFAVKAPVDAWIFVAAFLLVMLISLGTLLWQVGKAARINPAEVMKRE